MKMKFFPELLKQHSVDEKICARFAAQDLFIQ